MIKSMKLIIVITYISRPVLTKHDSLYAGEVSSQKRTSCEDKYKTYLLRETIYIKYL